MKATSPSSAFVMYKKMNLINKKSSNQSNKTGPKKANMKAKLKVRNSVFPDSSNGKKRPTKNLTSKSLLLSQLKNEHAEKSSKKSICSEDTTKANGDKLKKANLLSIESKKKKKIKSHLNMKTKTIAKSVGDSNSYDISVFPKEISDKSIAEDPFSSANTSDDPFDRASHLFEWLIHPVSVKNFFGENWEKKTCETKSQNERHYRSLFSSSELDQIFRQNDLFYTKNVDVVYFDGKERRTLNPEGKVHAAALWDFYENGCTIRVLNPQTYNKKIHYLVSTLQEIFGSMVGVNVYLTPPKSQGFAPHFDDIEAFVIQIEGSKIWRLYSPEKKDVLARHSSKNFTHEEIGTPFKSFTLKSGSMLYMPRGTIHEANSTEEHSLHLTISVYQNNAYVDLLEKILPNALKAAVDSDLDFRRGLPLQFIRDKNSHQAIKKQVVKLIDKLKNFLDVDAGIDEFGRKLTYDSMPPALTFQEARCSSKYDGDMLKDGVVYNRIEFEPSTEVRLARYHCVQLVSENQSDYKLYYSTENAKVYHEGEENWLELQPIHVDTVKILLKAYPVFVKIENLPMEDIQMKIQFIYDLWEKGILITREPLGAPKKSTELDNNEDVDDDSDVDDEYDSDSDDETLDDSR